MKQRFFLAALAMMLGASAFAQQDDGVTKWSVLASSEYSVSPNIVYKKASGFSCKLDVIAADHAKARPTLIYIHGGGWVGGSKEETVLGVLPYLARGMNVVNVEYRLASVSLAPAAVEDCRCALRWVYAHAKDYGFDLTKLVVSGHSAGGHLSLMTGMLTSSAGFDNECPGEENLKVAAIVNHYGITDVADLLGGPNREDYAVMWLGSLPNRVELARSLSPLTYIRKDLPPILTIHGDADDTVPYQHAVKLQEALNRAGVTNQLLTIPGGKHGGFSQEQNLKIQETIVSFLQRQGVLTR
jgi:acetyl esterase/lipase